LQIIHEKDLNHTMCLDLSGPIIESLAGNRYFFGESGIDKSKRMAWTDPGAHPELMAFAAEMIYDGRLRR
jgi:hypothetical protein